MLPTTTTLAYGPLAIRTSRYFQGLETGFVDLARDAEEARSAVTSGVPAEGSSAKVLSAYRKA